MPKREGELTAREAADLLGYKSSKSVHNLYHNRRLPGREERAGLLGKRLYFQRSDVERLRDETGETL